MGCGASTAVLADPVKPAQPVGLQEASIASPNPATAPAHVHHVTEAELAARGWGDSSNYLGMGMTFYAMPEETEEEKESRLQLEAKKKREAERKSAMEEKRRAKAEAHETSDKEKAGKSLP